MSSNKAENNYPQLPASPAEDPIPFQPTPAQLARARSQTRYEWLTLYLPLLFMGLLVLVILVGSIWGTTAGLGNEVMRWRTTVSAIADVIIILLSLSMTVACLIFPISAAAGWIYGRQQGWKPWETVRQFLWRIDQWVIKIQDAVTGYARQGAEIVIKSRSRWAYFENLWLWLRYFIFGR